MVECPESVPSPTMKRTKRRRRRKRHKTRTTNDEGMNFGESSPPQTATSHSVKGALEITSCDHWSFNLEDKRASISLTESMTESTLSTTTKDSSGCSEVKDQEDEELFIKDCVEDLIQEISMSPQSCNIENNFNFANCDWKGADDVIQQDSASMKIEDDLRNEIAKYWDQNKQRVDSMLHQCNSDEKGDDIEVEQGVAVEGSTKREMKTLPYLPRDVVIHGQEQQGPVSCSPPIIQYPPNQQRNTPNVPGRDGNGILRHYPMNNGYYQQWIQQRAASLRVHMPAFHRMDIEELMGYELTVREIIDFHLFLQFIGTKKGCHYLQGLVDRMSSDEEAMSIMNDFLLSPRFHLITDVAETRFGNQFIQCLFKKQMYSQHDALLKKWIYPFSLRLSGNIFGCRVIQGIIYSAAVSRDHKEELVSCLRRQITMNDAGRRALSQLVVSMNGNHVLQAALDLGLPAESVEFIRIELEKQIVYHCGNISACRVVQAYILKYGDRLNISPLLVNNHHIDLAQREYGNHVIQCILNPNAWYSSQPRFVQFRAHFLRDVFTRSNFLRLSRGKQGSHVLESCIRTADPEQIELLAKLCVSRKADLLKKMVWDEFGNYVLRTLFDHCAYEMKRVLAEAVQKYKVMPLDSMSRSESRGHSEFIYKVYWFRRELWGYTGYQK